MKNVLKSKRVWLFAGPVISAAIVGTATYHIGKAVQDDVYSTQIDDEIYTYNKLVDRYRKLEGWVKDEESKLDDKKKEVKEVKDAMKHKDKLTSEVAKLSSQVTDRQAEIEDLDARIDSKQSELVKLTSNVVEKEDEPKQFSAGQYFVGQDFPEGRYKAVPVGEGSNFQVYDTDSGKAVVNTILGHDKYSESEFVFYAQDGQYMETQARVKLIPVE